MRVSSVERVELVHSLGRQHDHCNAECTGLGNGIFRTCVRSANDSFAMLRGEVNTLKRSCVARGRRIAHEYTS